jgi:hypothetical protein
MALLVAWQETPAAWEDAIATHSRDRIARKPGDLRRIVEAHPPKV